MTFVSELHSTLAQPERTETAASVHELIAKAIERLDPGVEIKRTGYFTHSFVPDLVLRWGPQEERRERHVHLRFSVSGRPFEQDLDLLGDDAPLFVGMTDSGDLSHPAWARDGREPNGSLITQGPAIDELDQAMHNDARNRSATSPLVRVGHGLLDEPAAERITESYVGALRGIGDLTVNLEGARGGVSGALELLDQFLPESGHVELERALQSEWVKQGGDPFEFPSSTPWNPELLDVEALRDVLLALLGSESPVAPETWQRNAGFIRAEDIGRILGRSLRGGRFNELAHALLSNWTAKWVWATRDASPPIFTTYEWLIDDGMLGLAVADLRAFFADDGRHFKDKEGGNPLPQLSQAQRMLSQPGVLQVGLKGTTEGIRYESLRTTVRAFDRIREIIRTPGGGGYGVQAVTMVVPGTDWIADLDLDRQVIDFRGQSTPIATSARLASRFFARAVDVQGLDHFLATGEPLAAALARDQGFATVPGVTPRRSAPLPRPR